MSMPAPVAAIAGRQREWEDREWFPPGPQLAICLSGGKNRLNDLTDDELLQVAAAARRQTSWAQARELAAIAELSRRRTTAEDSGDPDYRILTAHESVTEEVSAALTVTGNTAATLVHLAEQLTGPLAQTGDALGAGVIDMAKARVICDVTEHLPEQVAGRVERAALEKASAQTTGQLRRRIKRIAQRLAPEAIEERRQDAVRRRRLEVWDTPSGTSDLALCDLAAEDAHAIFNKITAAANGIKTDGDTRPLNTIRADLATQLLHGSPLPDAIRVLLTDTPDPDAAPATSGETTATSTHPPHGELIHDASTSTRAAPVAAGETQEAPRPCACGGDRNRNRNRNRNRSSAAQPVPAPAAHTGDDNAVPALAAIISRQLDHVSGRVHPAQLPAAITSTVQHIQDQLSQVRDATCQGDDHRHGSPGYRLPAALRREIQARHTTCVFPTCNQPSHRCDLDHTIPWRPGITCRCNLAPLCRKHHRTKQSPGWKLHQIWPGLLIWITPSGAWYIIRPERQ